MLSSDRQLLAVLPSCHTPVEAHPARWAHQYYKYKYLKMLKNVIIILMFSLQGLQLVLRDMSNPLDMDPRRQLALQNKGNMLMLSSSVGFAQRALISSHRNLLRKQ